MRSLVACGVWALVVASGCKLGETSSSAAGAAPAARAPLQAAPAPVAAPAPARPVYEASTAGFLGEQLEVCVDYTLTPNAGQETEAAGRLAKLGEKPAKPKTGELEVVRIPRHCVDQFAGRTIIATCVVAEAAAQTGRLTETIRYFNEATIGGSDAEMRDCLKMHGDWQPNTDKWAVQHERVKGQLKQLEKLAAQPDP